MKTEDITNSLWIDVLELREELSIYSKDILYMSRHREAIQLDKNINGEFKDPILQCIDKEIESLASICKDIEEEITRYESYFEAELNGLEVTLGQAE
jgi:hypothetical protein